MERFDPAADYPLGSRRPDLVCTPSGIPLPQLGLAELREGRIPEGDLRATPETLRLQAEVARTAGRSQLAANLERAAELTALPDDFILDVYTALRPGRSRADQLEGWARRLEDEYGAPAVAGFVREAAAAYAARGLLA